MAGLTNKQKKEWAKSLITREGYTQKEAAEKVGVSAVTMNKWYNQENWEQLKASITITKEEQLKSLYRQLAEINKAIATREDGSRYATSGEADTITKLANAIQKMEGDIGVSDIISVGERFINFLRKVDLEKAKETTLFYDSFIKDSLK
jgi:uncharacterized protein YjcR